MDKYYYNCINIKVLNKKIDYLKKNYDKIIKN